MQGEGDLFRIPVLIHLAITFPPVVELAGSDVEPPDGTPGADLGLLRPAPDKIHDLVPRIVRNPDAVQSSPSVFFLGPHAPPSTLPGPILGLDLLLQIVNPFLLGCMVGPLFRLVSSRPVLEELLLPAVEDSGLESVLVT